MNFWDQRYSQEDFAYGKEPNEYLKSKLLDLPPGRILFPAEGEGRNAVFAAQLGWDVFAFDSSIEGKKKAEKLALENGVAIDYQVEDLEEADYPANYFDAIALSYTHFPEVKRRIFHQKLSAYLKNGGILILECFSKKHLDYQKENPNAGGPKDESMLFDLEELKEDFKGFDFLEAYETETELTEGLYHVGKVSVIRLFGVKKA
ncbi:class I SAM-dependent methyltransferase [Algoriphagus marinus]|uniref:class I SAM-dependent methyltransferase n=1 Tax=Algoriphagus marinus TaxID=1925762 RepID=UPI0009FA4BF4|nr:class I SAM-dependent methyltransferase [Algoriphagus marinus]